MNLRGKNAVLAALAAALIASFFYFLRPFDWPKYHVLASQGQEATGWVTGKDSAALAVYYSFSAGKGSYSGDGKIWGGREAFDQYSVGDRIFIYYLPSDPSVSIPGNPRNFLRNQNAVLCWLMILALAMAGWFFSKEIRKIPPR